MNKDGVLFLGPDESPLLDWLRLVEPVVFNTKDKINKQYIENNNISFLVSYRYRYIISKDIIKYLSGKAINLHVSYLPWNKGADPNFWSFIDNTVKGVTIHYIDESIDNGDIIIQEEVKFDFNKETLSSSYNILNYEIIRLFKEYWVLIKEGKCQRFKQKDKGSYHREKDKDELFSLLDNGWDTKVIDLLKIVSKAQ